MPTMGALHQGHLALVERSKRENDLTVCSIFVNPIQFNKPEDLAKYPRTEEQDSLMLREVGCDVLFMPSVDEFYPSQVLTSINFGTIEQSMEGAFRPGHFSGVGVVLCKFFNLVKPQKAYFGQKDFQQCAVVRQLIVELDFDIELVICPTLREASGLAMSSRNKRLKPTQLENASKLYRALQTLAQVFRDGLPLKASISTIKNTLEQDGIFEVEYIEFVDTHTLAPVGIKHDPARVVVCIAALIDGVRLIDNLLVEHE